MSRRGGRQTSDETGQGTTIAESELQRIDSLLYDADRLASSLPAAERREFREAEESITEARRHAQRHEGLFQLY